jgi:hypothetical protein
MVEIAMYSVERVLFRLRDVHEALKILFIKV